jgi:hypothetical protein
MKNFASPNIARKEPEIMFNKSGILQQVLSMR